MTQPVDAVDMAERITRLGLAEEFVVKDLLFELENKKGPAEPLIRLMERRGLLTPFQSAKLLKGESDGYFLGGYRLLYRIASGTFGKVYRGDDPRTGQVVAVKVLRRKWLDDENRAHRIAQFEREGRIGLTLRHPNIVQILAVSQDPHTKSHFIVMEFVEGGNLRDILTIRKKVGLHDSLKIMEECAAGLAHAYERGLTHRDIKPSNILLGTDGVAKLVDFGLAENAPVAGPVGPPGAVKAKAKGKEKEKEEDPAERTLDYAGLEKATGVRSGDVRSDIYFLGHALFEMIAGVPLMERTKNPRMAMEKRRFEMVEPVLARMSDEYNLPPVVRSLIGKAVAFEPLRRFQTPNQYLDAIRSARSSLPQPESAVKATPSRISPPEPRRVPGPNVICVVEPHEKLRGIFQEKLGQLGFEVRATHDSAEALPTYKSQPYHALLVDGGVTGVDGIAAFAEVLRAATTANNELAGVLILNEGQRGSGIMLAPDPRVAVLVRPVTMRQLAEKLVELMPSEPGEHE
jgi:eukaryotic-like serine/threonine-protein kinase